MERGGDVTGVTGETREEARLGRRKTRQTAGNSTHRLWPIVQGYLYGGKLTIIHKYLHVRCSV